MIQPSGTIANTGNVFKQAGAELKLKLKLGPLAPV